MIRKRMPGGPEMGRIRSSVKRTAAARRRLERLRQMSEEGATLQEASDALGLTVKGARNLLLRHEGTSTWPIVP